MQVEQTKRSASCSAIEPGCLAGSRLEGLGTTVVGIEPGNLKSLSGLVRGEKHGWQ
jgi:hypothetical protein